MSLSEKLGVPNKSLKQGAVWEGPEGEGPQGGITQSLIGKFLSDRVAFGLYAKEGLAPHDSFSAPMEYGSMWHVAEETHRGKKPWAPALLAYCKTLQKKYQMDAEKVAHWYQMCLAQFPAYVEFWGGDEKGRKVLESEQTFDVKYTLPHSKRVVRLRGKRDGVSLIDGKVWLDENKTKSQIDQVKIAHQLKFDLQTMLYLVALQTSYSQHEIVEPTEMPEKLVRVIDSAGGVEGVRYNVIRRSAHKTPESMLKKIQEDVVDGRGGEWFARWAVPVSAKEVEVFRRTCLDPILEWLCVWWDTVNGRLVHLNALQLQSMMNYRSPYGVYSAKNEGVTSEYDYYLESGSMAGLRKVKSLFPELET